MKIDFKLFVGISIIFFFFLLLSFSFFWIPQSIYEISLENRLASSNLTHWLGTDQLGRDFYSRLLVGTRNSILISSFAIGIGSFVGTLLGLLSIGNRASLASKTFSYFLAEFNKLLIAFPIVLIAILINALYGSGGWKAMLSISFFNIPIFYYLTRNISYRIWSKNYLLFSLAIGANRWSIYKLHILPQLISPWLILFSIQWGLSLLAESSLSYLGLGIQPPEPSLGRIIYESHTYFYLKSSLIILPGIILLLLVLAVSYLGDYFAKYLDPKSSN